MKKIIFGLPDNEFHVSGIADKLPVEKGELLLRHFPDGESYLKINSEVLGKEAIVICSMHFPDDKILPLFFLCSTLKELGAAKITLVSPYLAYMRQDKRFEPGEAVTSDYFAALISSFVNEMITIDPHLHRRSSLSQIYTIPCKVLHSAEIIADYIRTHIPNALLIGPDVESKQWVSVVADRAGTPFIVLNKERFGDHNVKITFPNTNEFQNHVPVLLDDIISTARTMIEAISHLKKTKMQAPVCIGVHAVFAENAYEELKLAGAAEVISCNTISHFSNKIDITELLVNALLTK